MIFRDAPIETLLNEITNARCLAMQFFLEGDAVKAKGILTAAFENIFIDYSNIGRSKESIEARRIGSMNTWYRQQKEIRDGFQILRIDDHLTDEQEELFDHLRIISVEIDELQLDCYDEQAWLKNVYYSFITSHFSTIFSPFDDINLYTDVLPEELDQIQRIVDAAYLQACTIHKTQYNQEHPWQEFARTYVYDDCPLRGKILDKSHVIANDTELLRLMLNYLLYRDVHTRFTDVRENSKSFEVIMSQLSEQDIELVKQISARVQARILAKTPSECIELQTIPGKNVTRRLLQDLFPAAKEIDLQGLFEITTCENGGIRVTKNTPQSALEELNLPSIECSDNGYYAPEVIQAFRDSVASASMKK